MKYTLFQGVQVETVTTNLQYLAEMWRSGKLISFHKWLQRLLQEKKWKSNKSKKARQYLTSLFGTEGVVQGFLICDINLLIDKIKSLYIRLIVILILTLLFFLLWAELAVGIFKTPISGS